MTTIDQYVQFIENKVFPERLESLKKCKEGQEISLWRKLFIRDLYSKLLDGENVEDFNQNPQEEEENKNAMIMSQRVYLEAKRLEDD